jgi:oxygen-dependent protoporphyrinogen oxidase
VVFEASEQAGGLVRSERLAEQVVDVGADAFLARRPEAVALCAELGMSESLVSPRSQTAFVWSRNALRRFPAGLVLGVPTRLRPLASSGIVSPGGVARAALDLVMPTRRPASEPVGSDRSVGEIVSRRLGQEVVDSLTGPLVGGINAGCVDELSAEVVFPALAEANRRGGSLMRALRPSPGSDTPQPSGGGPGATVPESPVFLTPVSGMASIPERLAAQLAERGVEIRVADPVERVDSGSDRNAGQWVVRTQTSETVVDGLVVAVPSRIAAGLLDNVDSQLATLLRGIETASVVVVTLQLGRGSLRRPLDGTGFLVPASHGKTVTAATFLSTKWQHLARPDEVLLRASAGRYGDNRAIDTGEDELVGIVRRELGEILGPLGDPQQVLVSRFANSFPQYRVGHKDRVSAIESKAAENPAFALAGASYGGIGVPACIASGRRAARNVARALQASGATAPSAW